MVCLPLTESIIRAKQEKDKSKGVAGNVVVATGVLLGSGVAPGKAIAWRKAVTKQDDAGQ